MSFFRVTLPNTQEHYLSWNDSNDSLRPCSKESATPIEEINQKIEQFLNRASVISLIERGPLLPPWISYTFKVYREAAQNLIFASNSTVSFEVLRKTSALYTRINAISFSIKSKQTQTQAEFENFARACLQANPQELLDLMMKDLSLSDIITLSDIAVENKHLEMMKALLKKGLPKSQVIQLLNKSSDHYPLLESLLAHVDQKTKYDFLFTAIQDENLDLVTFLSSLNISV